MKTPTYSVSKEVESGGGNVGIKGKDDKVYDIDFLWEESGILVRVVDKSELRYGAEGRVTTESFSAANDHEGNMDLFENTVAGRRDMQRWLRNGFGIKVKLVR